jgi:hypothetical protein
MVVILIDSYYSSVVRLRSLLWSLLGNKGKRLTYQSLGSNYVLWFSNNRNYEMHKRYSWKPNIGIFIHSLFLYYAFIMHTYTRKMCTFYYFGTKRCVIFTIFRWYTLFVTMKLADIRSILSLCCLDFLIVCGPLPDK